jgi:hypothetical protein
MAAFFGVQLLACVLITTRSPLILRRIGGLLLLPASAVLLVFGNRVGHLIVANPLLEGVAIGLFFGFNAIAWFGVSRCCNKAKR